MDIGLAYFDGYCRDTFNNKNGIKYIHASDTRKCHDLCKITAGCRAFAFERNGTFEEGQIENCDLYQGGPYIKGTGDNDIACYLMSNGKLF